jgi:WD40 repeat protein
MNFVAVSSDGLTVAGNGNIPGGRTPGLGLWTFPAGDYLRRVDGQPLAISPDFKYLATETSVLELQTGKAVFRISNKRETLTHAAFCPAGEYVALVGSRRIGKDARKQITIVRTADGSVVASFCTRYTAALAFNRDNQTLASGHWNNVTLWDARSGAKLGLLVGAKRPANGPGYSRDAGYVYGLGFSRDGKLLAAGTDDGELQIWDVTTRKLLHHLNIGSLDVSDPAFSPDGKLLAAGTYGDGTVSLVDASSGKILSQIKVSMFGCGSVAFSPDGRYLVTPSNGGQIGRRRYERGGTIRVFRVEN